MAGRAILVSLVISLWGLPLGIATADAPSGQMSAPAGLCDTLPASRPAGWDRQALVASLNFPRSTPGYALVTTETDLLDTVYFLHEKRILLKRTFERDRLGPDGQIKGVYGTALAEGGMIIDVDVYSGEAGTRSIRSEIVQHQFFVDPAGGEVKEVVTIVTEQAERTGRQWKKTVVIPRREIDPKTNRLVMALESNGRIIKQYAWDNATKQWVARGDSGGR